MNRNDVLMLEAYYSSIVLNEGNPVQQKFNKWLERGYTLGIVSPESTEEHMLKAHEGSTPLAHKKMVKGLYYGKKANEILGWTGPHAGQYVYNPEADSNPSEDQPLHVGQEGSYIVIPTGTDEESVQKMIRFIKKMGNAFFQESVMIITPDRQTKYIYLKRRVPHKADQEDPIGKAHYNKPLATSTKSFGAGGRTAFKKSSGKISGKDSFTAY